MPRCLLLGKLVLNRISANYYQRTVDFPSYPEGRSILITCCWHKGKELLDFFAEGSQLRQPPFQVYANIQHTAFILQVCPGS